jgi:hypothetical protein
VHVRFISVYRLLRLHHQQRLSVVFAETYKYSYGAVLFAGAEAEYRISEVIPHDNYTVDADDNDIAILKLSSDVTFNGYISPICVPDSNCKDGTPCVATGWGNTMGK